MDMGAGGLLAEIPTRPSPREGKPKPQRRPRVAAIVLAAGTSSRMGSNKLLADIGGQPMITHTVAAMRHRRHRSDHRGDRPRCRALIEAALAGPSRDLRSQSGFRRMACRPRSQRGACGACRQTPMPCWSALATCRLSTPDAGRRLIAAFSPAEHRSICVPVLQGKRGNPVLWGQAHLPALMAVTGDRGGQALLDLRADEVVEVEMPDRAVLTDIDTPQALDDVRSGRLP